MDHQSQIMSYASKPTHACLLQDKGHVVWPKNYYRLQKDYHQCWENVCISFRWTKHFENNFLAEEVQNAQDPSHGRCVQILQKD